MPRASSASSHASPSQPAKKTKKGATPSASAKDTASRSAKPAAAKRPAAASTAKTRAATADKSSETVREFKAAVNMTASSLKKYLASDDSRASGQKTGGSKLSIGHASGEKIVRLLGKKAADYTPDDLAHMRKVISYIRRHTAQRPDHSAEELRETTWRYSLMNWGHDPLKAESKK